MNTNPSTPEISGVDSPQVAIVTQEFGRLLFSAHPSSNPSESEGTENVSIVIGKVEATAGELARLDRCEVLTPGDFAAVARQHRFRPFETPSNWITALENECRHKPGRGRPAIGFGAAVAS
jgi:hypothetical protein